MFRFAPKPLFRSPRLASRPVDRLVTKLKSRERLTKPQALARALRLIREELLFRAKQARSLRTARIA